VSANPSLQLPLLGGLDAVLSGPLAPEELEERLAKEQIGPVIAVDEAGRGPLAGPVVAGAVAFEGPCRVKGVNDSKCLKPAHRAALVPKIQAAVRACAVGIATAEEIDTLNILEATRLATQRAIESVIAALGEPPAILLTDALTLPAFTCPVVPIIRGDARVRAIGAASILAKEHRDALMRRLHRQWPMYGFDQHFGYPTPLHRDRIGSHGPSTIHRLTFRGAQRVKGKPLRLSRLQQHLLRLRERAGAPAHWRERLERLRAVLPEREIQAMLELCAPLR